MSKPTLFQKIQDYFCRANRVYLSCLNREDGVITKAYGTENEKVFLHSIAGESRYMNLLSRLEDCAVESVIEEPLDVEYAKLYGVSVSVDGEQKLMWAALALIDEKIPDDVREKLPQPLVLKCILYLAYELARNLLIVREDADCNLRVPKYVLYSLEKGDNSRLEMLSGPDVYVEVWVLLYLPAPVEYPWVKDYRVTYSLRIHLVYIQDEQA